MPTREMLINYVAGEECRIAIVEDGRLEELYHERTSNESHVGNIYKGRVTNVEPSIQAAFIDFGLERNGFLHISDLHPKYFPADSREAFEAVGKKTPRRERPPIQKCLKRGQEVLVQVLKEGIGTKGPTLTSYLSIPGRFVVMMPFMERLGVSRKIEDDEQRRNIRDVLDELKPPDGFGFIVRTAGLDRTKTDLKRDLAYLQRLWKNIERRRKQIRVGELYTESDLVIRTLRDVYSSDIHRVIVDDAGAARRASDFLAISNPRSGSSVLVYNDPIPLFHRYGVEAQIENIHARNVPLPSGGSLVIEATEALVAVDVNSGRMRSNSDAEVTAYKTNVEACDEVCRQLRLRDLGGVVVIDLIDMRQSKHRRAIEQRFREWLKKDRARTRILTISQFGIMEMTRQRMRPSLNKSVYIECRHCSGEGEVKSPESVVLDVMRRLALAMHREAVTRIELTVSPDVAFLLLNRKREHLVRLEQRHGKAVMVRVNQGGPLDSVHLAAFDARGGEVDALSLAGLPDALIEPVETVAAREDEARSETDASEDREDAVEATLTKRAEAGPDQEQEDEAAASEGDTGDDGDSEGTTARRKRRRRRRRGGRGRSRSEEGAESDAEATGDAASDEAAAAAAASEAAAEASEAEPPAMDTHSRPTETDAGAEGLPDSSESPTAPAAAAAQEPARVPSKLRRHHRKRTQGPVTSDDAYRLGWPAPAAADSGDTPLATPLSSDAPENVPSHATVFDPSDVSGGEEGNGDEGDTDAGGGKARGLRSKQTATASRGGDNGRPASTSEPAVGDEAQDDDGNAEEASGDRPSTARSKSRRRRSRKSGDRKQPEASDSSSAAPAKHGAEASSGPPVDTEGAEGQATVDEGTISEASHGVASSPGRGDSDRPGSRGESGESEGSTGSADATDSSTSGGAGGKKRKRSTRSRKKSKTKAEDSPTVDLQPEATAATSGYRNRLLSEGAQETRDGGSTGEPGHGDSSRTPRDAKSTEGGES